ncbi:MAG: GAF domain-containing protein [Anaerolineae bacterium]|nr:MAG: GAF domain-containing protein [Anaerolineae bacterium]
MAEPQTSRTELELLYRVSRELASALDLRTVLQRVLFAAMENVGGERGSIVVLDDNANPIDATIVYGREFHEHTTQQLRDTVERGLAGWVIRNRKAALVPDTSKDERWLRRPDDSIEKSGAKSAICAPLLARERLVGVLTLVHPQTGAFEEKHLKLMQAIADQAGIAVLNARLYAESQRQARVMTALAEGAMAINASLRMEEVLNNVLEQTMRALQVETVALALIDSSSGELVFRAAAGKGNEGIIGNRLPTTRGAVTRVIQEGRGVVIPSVSREDYLPGVQARALAIAPIHVQGRVIGILTAVNPLSRAFDPDALLVMSGIGSLAGTTIQNAHLFEQLQAAHRRYRELFEDSVDAILITDWDGNILEANRRAVTLTGYDEEKLRGLSIDQVHEVNWNKIGLEFENLRNGETQKYESTLHCAGESTIPVEIYVHRVQFAESDALQWILHDIRERKALDELRDDLTAMIYHDLRSPLANIISSLDVLDSLLPPEKDEAIQSVLRIAQHAADRIQRLINSLLDIHRLESGQPVGTLQAVPPVLLIERAVEDVRATAEMRKQSLRTNVDRDLPHVWVDANMIRRVLINLLENAIKFTPLEGDIEIGAAAEKDQVRFWVQDSGPGIPPADQERIFTKFTRLRKEEGAPGGLGIGLAFCRLAVESHGGRIWVESEPGHGARFILTLPTAEKTT